MPEKFPSPEFGEPTKEERKQEPEQEPEPKAKEGRVESGSLPDNHNRPESTESPHKIDRSIEELRQIEEIRRTLEEREWTSPRQQEEAPVIQNPTEVVTVRGQRYTVEYVPKEEIYPAFGYGGGDKAVVRQDLPPRVKNFVKAHELYHCRDQATWGGWLGREFRANLIPGLKDPIGLLATVWATVSDIDRMKFYLNRLKEKR